VVYQALLAQDPLLAVEYQIPCPTTALEHAVAAPAAAGVACAQEIRASVAHDSDSPRDDVVDVLIVGMKEASSTGRKYLFLHFDPKYVCADCYGLALDL